MTIVRFRRIISAKAKGSAWSNRWSTFSQRRAKQSGPLRAWYLKSVSNAFRRRRYSSWMPRRRSTKAERYWSANSFGLERYAARRLTGPVFRRMPFEIAEIVVEDARVIGDHQVGRQSVRIEHEHLIAVVKDRSAVEITAADNHILGGGPSQQPGAGAPEPSF